MEILLDPPNVDYLRDLLKKLEGEPQYLFYHEVSVGSEIQRMLFNGGIRWEGQTIMSYCAGVLRVAMERLERV